MVSCSAARDKRYMWNEAVPRTAREGASRRWYGYLIYTLTHCGCGGRAGGRPPQQRPRRSNSKASAVVCARAPSTCSATGTAIPACCLLLALAWDWRTGLPGWPGHHSTGLLLLTLVGGFVGCFPSASPRGASELRAPLA